MTRTKISNTILFSILCLYLNAQGPNFQWAKAFTGGSNQVGSCIDLDGAGNVYSCGYFFGAADFDPGAGTFFFSNIGIYDGYVSKLDPSGNFIWAKQFGGSGGRASIRAMKIDAAGNVVIAGNYKDTVDFDPGTGVYNLIPVGAADAFVCKLDSSGSFLWAKNIGSAGDDYCAALAFDATGDIYVAGAFSATADFDPDVTGTYNLTSFGNLDGFACKLSSNGLFVWAKQFGGITDEFVTSLAPDGLGGIIVTGAFNSATADFDPGTGVYTLTNSSAAEDIYVLKLDNNGGFVWVKQIGGAASEMGYSVTADINGNIYTSGVFASSGVDFDPGAGTSVLSAASANTDIYILKLDQAGNFQWVKQIGGADSDYSFSLKQDATGILVTGYFGTDTCDFDPGAGVYSFINNDLNSNDIFLLKLDVSGNFVFASQMGGIQYDAAYDVVSDNSGNIYLTGSFAAMSNCDFDPGPAVYNISGSSQSDAFVCKLSQVSASLGSISTSGKELLLFPNPFHGTFSISSAAELSACTLEIYDIGGRLVYSENGIKGKEVRINSENLNSGLYFLRIKQKEEIIFSGKLNAY